MNKLYEEPRFKTMASPTENRRVLELYLEEKLRVLGPGHPQGHKCQLCGDFRGDLARDWVEVATKAGLRIPGAKAKKKRREGWTELDFRIDAARTRIRNFEQTSQEYDWTLVGIETTINDRRGLAYPPGAYQTQGQLDV